MAPLEKLSTDGTDAISLSSIDFFCCSVFCFCSSVTVTGVAPEGRQGGCTPLAGER